MVNKLSEGLCSWPPQNRSKVPKGSWWPRLTNTLLDLGAGVVQPLNCLSSRTAVPKLIRAIVQIKVAILSYYPQYFAVITITSITSLCWQ